MEDEISQTLYKVPLCQRDGCSPHLFIHILILSWSVPPRVPTKMLNMSSFRNICYMPCQFHPPLFDYRNTAKHEVLRAVNMHITVFWKVTPCSLVYGYQRYGQNCIRPCRTLRSSGRLLRNVDTRCNVLVATAC